MLWSMLSLLWQQPTVAPRPPPVVVFQEAKHVIYHRRHRTATRSAPPPTRIQVLPTLRTYGMALDQPLFEQWWAEEGHDTYLIMKYWKGQKGP